MKHALFAVLATTALTLSAPAFAAGNYNSSGNAAEHPGASGSGANGSPAEMSPNGSSRGSSSDVNGRNCLPQAQFRGMTPQAQARLKSQGISVCQPGEGESGGAVRNRSPSGSSRHQGNFDKDK